MTTSDKKKAQVLAGLLTIAGFTWFFVFGERSNQNTETKRKPGPGIARQIKDPTIQIGLIENLSLGGGGHKNIFQYRQEPLRQPASKGPTSTASREDKAPDVVDHRPLLVQRDTSKTFKYEGFSIRADGRMLASLNDGGNIYAVTLGECLVGQYCVRQLAENMIEIEDLELKQRRTFPRIIQ
jgi:hypothetical protein